MNKLDKFYMNNPCRIIREVTEDLVEIEVYPLTEVGFDGSQWCTECLAGHGYSSHQCGKYQEVIDVINEEREDKVIVSIVEKRLIMDEAIEFKKHEQLRKEIYDYDRQLSALKNEVYVNKQELTNLKKDLQFYTATSDSILSIINSKWDDLDKLEVKVTEANMKLNSIDNDVRIGGFKSNLCANELKQLYTAYHKIAALIHGGVDNWEWYGESLSNYGDIDQCVEASMKNVKLMVV